MGFFARRQRRPDANSRQSAGTRHCQMDDQNRTGRRSFRQDSTDGQQDKNHQRIDVGNDEERFVVGQEVPSVGFVPGKLVGDYFQPGCRPKFLPGRTIQTDEGLKFVAGQTSVRDNKFHPGQIFQTASGPAFIRNRTWAT